MSQFPDTGSRHASGPGTWPPQIRIAIVVAICLIVEAVVAKNVMHVDADPVALLAPLWVFAGSLAWSTKDRAAELATMILAIGAAAGVLVFYAL